MESNNAVRECLSMDRDWKFYLGDVKPPVKKNHLYTYLASKAGGERGAPQSSWDDESWETVDLPHDWAAGLDFDPEAQPSHGFKPRGIAWYRKRFFINPDDEGKQLLLEFDGIATHAEIYFNGSLLERNWSGYTSFAVDITDRALFGDQPNVLAVRVDATKWEGWWYEGAGIYRHVWLIKKAPLHIAHWGTWVNPVKVADTNWNTKIETKIENSGYQDRAFRLTSTIVNASGKVIGMADNTAICKFDSQAALKQEIKVSDPVLWDIDQPNLYTLISEVYEDYQLVDRYETKFGYRTIRICSNTGFYLNDKNVKIKGTCNHQDHAGLGVALPDSIHEYRIKRLKEMGSNAYRCAHNNPAPELLDACDKLGMLVMDENRSFESSPEGIRQLESMVLRDRNHPSIIFYSIFNEESLQGSPQGRKMSIRMKHAIKKLDDTRPVLAALSGGFMEDTGTADVFDITGFNYRLSFFDVFHSKHPNQPMIGSENNCTYSTRGIYETSEERRVFDCYDVQNAAWGDTIRTTWQAVNTRDFIMGLFVWTGFDYRGEPTPYEWPCVNSHWGVMDTCGFAKDAFYLHKACWADKPLMHILPHWNWSGHEGEKIKVMTHTNCEEAELFLNGRSMGRKSFTIYEQGVWEIPYEPGTLKMIGYINGEYAAEDEVQTAGEPAALVLEPDRNYIYGDGLDAIPVNVSAVDKEGRFMPVASNKIKFSIKGFGRIIGVGNGDPSCLEPDKANSRSLFNGRCQVIVQSTEGTGMLTLTAVSDGLRIGETVINVLEKKPKPYVTSVSGRFLNSWRMAQDIFTEKPDPNMEISATDMNTWEKINIGTEPQKKFEGTKGYGIYRTTIELPSGLQNKPLLLHFYRIAGKAEVYVNGSKVYEEDCGHGKEMRVAFDNASASITLTILIYSDKEHDAAGICRAVILSKQ